MPKSEKEARNIIVNSIDYRWRAKGSDGSISISIWPYELPHPGIFGSISYCEVVTEELNNGETIWRLTKQIVITNKLIQRIIKLAINDHGFDPTVKSKPLNLFNLEDHIDISDAERANR